ncbi:autophagy- protein 2 [Quaeritorhiza haematococci]|nr:autophagy- protein 2 [Quaeritorhiza haematococci]
MSSFWPFSNWSVPQTLQKRLLKFLLKKAIGQFLASELDLENLDVELGKGQVVLKDLELNVEALNDLALDLPVVIMDGRISQITAIIPWRDIWNGNCSLELQDLQISLMPLNEDPEHGLSKSMYEDHQYMSSSIHLAGDFLRQEVTANDAELGRLGENSRIHWSQSPSSTQGGSPAPSHHPKRSDTGIEGIQVLARLIDKIMTRVQVTVTNTLVRVLHRSTHSLCAAAPAAATRGARSTGLYHMDIVVDHIAYSDETQREAEGVENVEEMPNKRADNNDDMFVPVLNKRIEFSGFRITLSELVDSALGDGNEDFMASSLNLQDRHSIPSHGDSEGVHGEGGEVFDTDDQNDDDTDTTAKSRQGGNRMYSVSDVVLISANTAQHVVSIQVKQSVPAQLASSQQSLGESLYATATESTLMGNSVISNAQAQWNVDVSIEPLCSLLTPAHFHVVLEIVSAIGDNSVISSRQRAYVNKDDLTPPMSQNIRTTPPIDLRFPPSAPDLRNRQPYANAKRNAGFRVPGAFDSELYDLEDTLSKGVGTDLSFAADYNNPVNYLLLKIHVESVNVYLTHVPCNQFPPRFTMDAFYHLFFNGASNLLSSAMPTDLSMSFVAQAKAGSSSVDDPTGDATATLDDVVADFIGVDHMLLRLCNLQARLLDGPSESERMRDAWSKVPYQNQPRHGGFNYDDGGRHFDLKLADLFLGEWLCGRNKEKASTSPAHTPPYETYNPIIQVDASTNKSQLVKFYDQIILNQQSPPKRWHFVDGSKDIPQIPRSSSKPTPSSPGGIRNTKRAHYAISPSIPAKKECGKPKDQQQRKLVIKSSLIRTWIICPDMTSIGNNEGVAVADRECHVQKDMIVVDFVNPQVSTSFGHSNVSRMSSTGGVMEGDHVGSFEAVSDGEAQQWRVECLKVGIGFAKPLGSFGGASHAPEVGKYGRDSLKNTSTKAHLFPRGTQGSVKIVNMGAPEARTLRILPLVFKVGMMSERPDGRLPEQELVRSKMSAQRIETISNLILITLLTMRTVKEMQQMIPTSASMTILVEVGGEELIGFAGEACHVNTTKQIFDSVQVLFTALSLWQPRSTLAELETTASPSTPFGIASDATGAWFDAVDQSQVHMGSSTFGMDTSIRVQQDEIRHPFEFTPAQQRHSKPADSFQQYLPYEQRSSISQSMPNNALFSGANRTADGQDVRIHHPANSFTSLLSVGSLNVVLHCIPKEDGPGEQQQQQRTSPPWRSQQHYNSYKLHLGDSRLFAVVGHAGKTVTYAWFESDDLLAKDITVPDRPTQFLRRTLPMRTRPSKPAGQQIQTEPMFSSFFRITFDKELNLNETTASLLVRDATLQYITNSTVLLDLIDFMSEPKTLALVDVTNRFTKLYVSGEDFCIEYRPLHLPYHVVAHMEAFKISGNIIPDSPTFGVKIVVSYGALYLSDDVLALDEKIRASAENGSFPEDVMKYFNQLGLANVASCDYLDLSLRTNAGDLTPHLELDVLNRQIYINTCADSFQTLLELGQYVADNRDIYPEGQRPSTNDTVHAQEHHIVREPLYADILANIEEGAFGQLLSERTDEDEVNMSSVPDPMESELLVVEDFFASDNRDTPGLGQSVLIPPELPSDRVWSNGQARESKDHGNAASSEDVIRVFDGFEDLRIVEDHFAFGVGGFEPDDPELSKDLARSLVRIRLRDVDIMWRIYDGYDWAKTRQVMIERNKAQVRQHGKRRSKEGSSKKRDSSGSMSAGVDFPHNGDNSYGESSPYSRSFNLQSEFGSGGWPSTEHDLETSSQRSFGSSTSGTSAASRRPPSVSSFTGPASYGSTGGWRTSPAVTNMRRVPEELSRSRESRIEIRAYTINVEFDVFPEDCHRATRLLVLIRDFEIIDNVRTSLWRKFLSHLRPESNNVPRETRSNMFEAEVTSVRPDPSKKGLEEFRLKVGNPIAPSRLASQGATTNEAFIHYKPKHVDYTNLKGGNLIEIMNFFALDGAEMTLRSVRLAGINGWSRLADSLINEWLPHIRQTQVPRVMSGVTGVRTLVNLSSGVADLILLPIEQYKKDGRIIKGLQKGARSFAKAATMETLRLGTRLAVGTQVLLEHADEILAYEQHGDSDDEELVAFESSGASSSSSPAGVGSSTREQHSKFSEQPRDVKEGIQEAYRSLSRNIGTAAKTILAVPMEVYENTGTQGTVRAVIRAVPVAVLKPMIGASEAVSKTLLGLQNTIDPNKKVQMEDKYKG